MLTDYAVAIGPDEDALEVPWSAPSGQGFLDLRARPELLLEIPEAAHYPEMGEFLARLNRSGRLFTAKCDVWTTRELTVIEEVFAKPWKFGSYVDVLLTDPAQQTAWAPHETLMKALTAKLSGVPEFDAGAEFILRRCYLHRGTEPDASDDGFAITVYVSGFGEEARTARAAWGIANQLTLNALLQMAPAEREQANW